MIIHYMYLTLATESGFRSQHIFSCISNSLNINRLLAYSSQQSSVKLTVNLSEAWVYFLNIPVVIMIICRIHKKNYVWEKGQ